MIMMEVGAENYVNRFGRRPQTRESVQVRGVEIIEVRSSTLPSVPGTGIDNHGEAVHP